MNFYIQQSIQINILRVNSISNSSVLQIGSAGIIKPKSIQANSGGFTEPAPPLLHNGIIQRDFNITSNPTNTSNS